MVLLQEKLAVGWVTAYTRKITAAISITQAMLLNIFLSGITIPHLSYSSGSAPASPSMLSTGSEKTTPPCSPSSVRLWAMARMIPGF